MGEVVGKGILFIKEHWKELCNVGLFLSQTKRKDCHQQRAGHPYAISNSCAFRSALRYRTGHSYSNSAVAESECKRTLKSELLSVLSFKVFASYYVLH